jgi:hypothetical protein
MAIQFTSPEFIVFLQRHDLRLYRRPQARFLQSLKYSCTIFNNLVNTTNETQCVYITKTNRLMWLGKHSVFTVKNIQGDQKSLCT